MYLDVGPVPRRVSLFLGMPAVTRVASPAPTWFQPAAGRPGLGSGAGRGRGETATAVQDRASPGAGNHSHSQFCIPFIQQMFTPSWLFLAVLTCVWDCAGYFIFAQ